MALNILWPFNSLSITQASSCSSTSDCTGFFRALPVVVMTSSFATRASFNGLQFSLVMRTLKGRAVENEGFETAEARVRNEGRTDGHYSSSSPSVSSFQNENLLRKVSAAKDAEEALSVIAEHFRGNNSNGGTVSSEDSAAIIAAALAQNNADLAFSVLQAMRCDLIQSKLERELQDGNFTNSSIQCWRWDQPDITTYTTLIRGLAASLRVSDAIRAIKDISCVGTPLGDEVSFGKVVKCPYCMIAFAVVQPQHGIQVVACSKCRYQYELMSGEIVNIESESISTNISVMESGLRILQIKKQIIPAAIHSIVIRAPNGLAFTHRFATQSADLPAQEGERVTIALAAPSNVGRAIGPFRLSTRTPGRRPREPMCITNHVTGLEFHPLQAPPKYDSSASFGTSLIVPAVALLASGDAATAFIDPTLPKLILSVAASAIVLGTAMNTLVMPQLNQLPQRMVDALAVRQQLLSQYNLLQSRLKDLIQAAEEEVWMLARMCNLENKIEVVGEPSYSARKSRVKRARENLDESLVARLKLIDSYAKLASMIEIEVEMDKDVFAAEEVTNASSIAEQIERLMELEDLEKQWRIQAEANDEIERLLRSAPVLPDSV